METKSTDRKTTLLHYISNVVNEKYESVSIFYNELHYVEKAAAGMPSTGFYLLVSVPGRKVLHARRLHAAVSLENVLLDVKELQRGMDLTRREYSMHGHNTLLKDFIAPNEGKLKKLQDDAKVAQVRGVQPWANDTWACAGLTARRLLVRVQRGTRLVFMDSTSELAKLTPVKLRNK